MSSISTILLVDDEEDIRTICEMALTTFAGWTVEMAADGAMALERVASVKPDLVLLDFMMPGMDGAETLQRLRADPATAHIPVIFMTAKVQRREVDAYLAMGAIGVISKPFDPMTLADEVSALAEGAR